MDKIGEAIMADVKPECWWLKGGLPFHVYIFDPAKPQKRFKPHGDGWVVSLSPNPNASTYSVKKGDAFITNLTSGHKSLYPCKEWQKLVDEGTFTQQQP